MATTFSEKTYIGDLSVNEKTGWVTRLALMEAASDKSTKQYYEIRKIKPNEDKTKQMFGKGITLNLTELKNLKEILESYIENLENSES